MRLSEYITESVSRGKSGTGKYLTNRISESMSPDEFVDVIRKLKFKEIPYRDFDVVGAIGATYEKPVFCIGGTNYITSIRLDLGKIDGSTWGGMYFFNWKKGKLHSIYAYNDNRNGGIDVVNANSDHPDYIYNLNRLIDEFKDKLRE